MVALLKVNWPAAERSGVVPVVSHIRVSGAAKPAEEQRPATARPATAPRATDFMFNIDLSLL
jgi:hypothetical protein